MNHVIRSYSSLIMGVFFLVIPAALVVFGPTPARGSWLKDFLSILTILGFSMMLGQMYLTRIKSAFTRGMKLPRVVRLHKAIGYLLVSVILLHPAFIVLPRYLEAGARPIDSLITMVTEFDNMGIVLGLAAYALMILLGITAVFRTKMPISYRQWRVLHGILSILFIAFGTWHAVDMGRHMDRVLSIYFITLATIGCLLVLQLYLFNNQPSKEPANG
ncbi:MAG: ferric reductase-like transmembrane domain-containing protein [Akkermansiaceae bacterium]|nr:ferric reductase-like transmembrane domain-containing protein [Akkermansiaceae bacterium]